jgi:glycosyltransferase involved in cell wall biosynthesis
MEYPKISIVIPSYNQGIYLEKCFTSIFDQDYPNLEIILIDGGSNDSTLDVIKKYESKLTYWVSEKDKGQTDAINKGFAICTGEIFNWLNSDDYLEDNALWNYEKAFRDPKINCVIGKINNFVEDADTTWFSENKPEQTSLDYVVNAFCNQPSTYFRREAIKSFFPLPECLHYTMDQFIWFCYWLENDVDSVKIEDFIGVNFRRHENSKTYSLEKGSEQYFKTLSYKFFNDYNSIFYNFFKETRNDDKAKVIGDYFFNVDNGCKSRIYNFNLNQQPEAKIELLYQKYLLSMIKEDLLISNFKRSSRKIKLLKPHFLNSKEKEELKKITIKYRYGKLLGVYRKLYWGLKK